MSKLLCYIDYKIISLAILLFVSLTTCLGYLQLLLNLSFAVPAVPVIAFIASICFIKKEAHISDIYIYLFLVLIIGTIEAYFMDVSWDGQWYHMQAVRSIVSGWNPYWSDELSGVTGAVWINSYPKATWVFGAELYQLTDSLNVGKMYQLLFAVANFLLVWDIAKDFMAKNKWRLVTAFLLAFNPVVSAQLFSYYVDSVLYSSMLAIAFVAFLWSKEERFGNRFYIALLVLLTAFLINLKFTALAYAGLEWLCILLLYFVYRRQSFKLCLFTSFIAMFFSVMIIGFNPYITNIMRHGHPFWPVRGEYTLNVMTAGGDDAFLNQSRVIKLFEATFSPSYNHEMSMDQVQYKIPGNVHASEIRALVKPDTRMGGFGIWFSLGVILAVIGSACLFNFHKGTLKPWLIVIAWLLLSVIINPESWWARYAPQFYVVFLLMAFLTVKGCQNQYGKFIGMAAVVVFLLNSMFCFVIHVGYEGAIQIQIAKAMHAAQSAAPIEVYSSGNFDSVLLNYFQRYDVPYHVTYIDDGSKKRNIVPGVPKKELYCLEDQSKPESRGEQQ